MLARILPTCLIGLLIWPSLTATADATQNSGHVSGSTRYSHGLLWKIETANLRPSYLFGTIHTDDPRVTRLPAPVKQAFDQADSFTMELIASGTGLVAMANRMFFDDGRTLEGVLGKTLHEQTLQALNENGIPIRGIEKKKPWTIVMALSAPRRPRNGLFLDLALQLQATLQAKPTYGLESMEEQIAVFDEMPIADQVSLLKETLRIHNQIKQQFEELVQAYLAQDLDRLMQIIHKYKPADDQVYNSMMDRLLIRRNKVMVERMQARLQEGNAFIAVGAGHLPGESGILRLLELSGYRLSAVY